MVRVSSGHEAGVEVTLSLINQKMIYDTAKYTIRAHYRKMLLRNAAERWSGNDKFFLRSFAKGSKLALIKSET